MLNLEFDEPHFLPQKKLKLVINLRPGELSFLVGENGVGKTTLAKLIHKKMPDSIYVEQKSLDRFYDRKIGLMKEILLDSRESILSKEKLERLWMGFGLNFKENLSLNHLSGGELQALKLSLCLCREGSFYILDEPFHFLDQSKREFLMTFLRLLLEEGKKVLVIEHHLPLMNEHSILRLFEENGIVQGERV